MNAITDKAVLAGGLPEKYTAARNALAAAVGVDEAKDIRDKAVAMQTYAFQAKDDALVTYATEIKMRATRRIGELMDEARQAGRMAKGTRGNLKGGNRGSGGFSKNLPEQTLEDQGVDKNLAASARKLAKMPEPKFEATIAEAKASAAAITSGCRRHKATKPYRRNDEWYTPAHIMDAVRAVLGGIDLDPASNQTAQERTIRAATWFGDEDDGLAQPWTGRVFLNPPFSKGKLEAFVDRMIDAWQRREITAGIMLTNNFTDAEWFQRAFAACSAVCFTEGRINFANANGKVDRPLNGHALFYFGDDVDRFVSVFGERIGCCSLPIRGRRREAVAKLSDAEMDELVCELIPKLPNPRWTKLRNDEDRRRSYAAFELKRPP
jgi:phage N-6-adenine-methyltransferase